MGDDLASLEVVFTANISQLSSQMGAIGEASNGMSDAFRLAAEGMAEALGKPLDQVIAVQSAAEQAAAGIGESIASASESFGELGSAAEEASTSIGDNLASASESFSELGGSGDSAGSQLMEVLLEITTSINNVQYAIEAMSGSVTGSIEDLSVEFSSVGESAGNAASEIESAGGQVSGSGGGGFLSFFNQLGIGIFNIQNMINIGKQLADTLLGPAQSAETVTTALTTLDGSAQAASQEMSKLNAFAAKTPFKTLDIDTAAEQLQGFGYNASSVIPMIQSIGDALGSVGKETPAEMLSVVDIFGKIKTEGKLTAAQMNELGIHGINAWKALADGAGMTIPQVQDLVKKGLLPAGQAVQDLTKGIELNPLYAGGMARSAGTFTGLLSTLQSNFQQVIASFGTPIIKALEGQLNNLGNILASPAFQQFAGSVGQGIVNVFSSIGATMHGLNMSSLASSFGNMGGVFKNLGSTLSTTLGGAFKSVGSILASINWGNVMTTVGTLASVVGGVLAHAFQVLSPILAQVAKWFTNDVLPALNKALPPIGNLINSVMDFVGAALQPLLSALEPLIPPIITIAGNIATLLTPAFKALTPAIQFIGPIIEESTKPLQVLLDLLSGNWKGALNSIGLGFLTVGDKALQMKIKVAEAHTQMALITDQKTAEGAAHAIANMEKERQGILQKLKETTDPAEKAELTHQLNMLDIQENAQKQKLQKADEDKKAQLAKQKELHDQMLEAQKSGFQRMLDGLGAWFTQTLPQAVGGWFSTFGKFWHDRWTDITNAVGNIFSGIGSGVKNGINDVIQDINDFIGALDSIQIHIPSIGVGPVKTPAFNWNGLGIGKIPRLATGGSIAPGAVALTGDIGPELVFGGMSGAEVLNNAQSMAALRGAGTNEQQPIQVHVYLDGRELTQQLGMNMLSMIRSHGPVGATL